MGEALRLLIDYQIKSNYVPSPLAAVVNVLLLKEKICLPSHTTVSSCQLFLYILHVIKKLHKKRAKSVVYPKFENKQCRAGNSVRFRKNIINTMFWLLFALDVRFFFDSRTLFAFLLFVHYCSLLFLEKITIKFFSFLVFTGKIILVGRMKKLQKMLKRIKSTSLASKKIIFFFFEENYTKKCFFLFQYLIISLNLATRFLFTFQICETIEEDETHAPESPPLNQPSSCSPNTPTKTTPFVPHDKNYCHLTESYNIHRAYPNVPAKTSGNTVN